MIATAQKTTDFAAARRHMIESQLRTSGVNDSWVLERMAAVPREDFVPEAARAGAYVDRTVPLGDDAFLAPPLAQGLILTHARPAAADRALVVGPATGYLAALLAPLVGELEQATPESVLSGNIEGTFDLVIVDGAVEQVPAALAATLSTNGRLVTGVIRNGVTRLELGRRSGDGVSLISVTEAQLPRLAAFDAPPSWTF